VIPPQTADNKRLFDETEPLADIGCLDRRHAEWLRILRRTRAYPPLWRQFSSAWLAVYDAQNRLFCASLAAAALQACPGRGGF